MTTRSLVHPELDAFLDEFPAFTVSAETLPLIRQGVLPASPDDLLGTDVVVEDRRIAGPTGAPEVRVLVYHPAEASTPLPGLLWIHGGGYVLGSADADDLLVRDFVSKVGCMAVSVDYRLAPETPFPGPVEDCYAALTWMHAHAEELGLDAGRIAIGGASAGGGLAAGLGLLARDRGEVPLAFQLLIYPMLDDRTVTHPDPHPHVGEFVWTRESNQFGWQSLLGHEPGLDAVSPYAAAARAEHLAGLPPTYINVGTLDLFLEEDLEYARRLMRAGVPTELHVYPGAYHGFNRFKSASVTQSFDRDMIAALRRGLGQP
ncbi:alpha/beta hydrolase [Deinococcus ruber]|uniref:Alpha/beta hydrolase fold-3 domain-containing protein n=1 Tax=Deinococcus ruber TaxID=1848197 RepID=A0A918CKV9_9DEIO|nr:alpha/beta hydrolase [Deinococcus ruber]GGR26746.1 hypothetical protein GCM10008957_42770 [Deinococcus ruber]